MLQNCRNNIHCITTLHMTVDATSVISTIAQSINRTPLSDQQLHCISGAFVKRTEYMLRASGTNVQHGSCKRQTDRQSTLACEQVQHSKLPAAADFCSRSTMRCVTCSNLSWNFWKASLKPCVFAAVAEFMSMFQTKAGFEPALGNVGDWEASPSM